MFPAYAGMIRDGAADEATNVGVPRIRGDDPGIKCRDRLQGMCSPHTRG